MGALEIKGDNKTLNKFIFLLFNRLYFTTSVASHKENKVNKLN